MDLAHARQLALTQLAPDLIQLEGVISGRRFSWQVRAEAGEYLDSEDAMWLLIKHEAPASEMRSAIGACWPDFDVDAEIAQSTMPDRDERRALDAEHRQALRAKFRISRGRTPF